MKGDIVSRLIDMGIRVYDFEPLFYRGRVAAGTGYLIKVSICNVKVNGVILFQKIRAQGHVWDIVR